MSAVDSERLRKRVMRRKDQRSALTKNDRLAPCVATIRFPRLASQTSRGNLPDTPAALSCRLPLREGRVIERSRETKGLIANAIYLRVAHDDHLEDGLLKVGDDERLGRRSAGGLPHAR